MFREGIVKLLRSPVTDSEESIDFASLCSLPDWYDNPIPIDCYKIPEPVYVYAYGAQESISPGWELIPGLLKRSTNTVSAQHSSFPNGWLKRAGFSRRRSNCSFSSFSFRANKVRRDLFYLHFLHKMMKNFNEIYTKKIIFTVIDELSSLVCCLPWMALVQNRFGLFLAGGTLA